MEQGYKSKVHCGYSITYLSLEVFVMVVSVGVDVSKDKHDCFIVSSEGGVLADVFTIPNTMDGFAVCCSESEIAPHRRTK